MGSDHNLDSVTFYLPNYADLFGGHTYHEEVRNGDTRTSISWSEVALEAENWHIALQPHPKITSLREKALENRSIVLSGIGEIRRANGEQFKKKHVRPILEALRLFLSFSFGDWCPPLFVVGSNEVAAKSWQMWANYDLTPQPYLKGWVDEQHGQFLAGAFPAFLNLWTKDQWKDPLELAVTWLIQASRQSGTDGAIAFGQIPLEMLAWVVFVDDKTVIDADEFERLSAASKLQMLLSHC